MLICHIFAISQIRKHVKCLHLIFFLFSKQIHIFNRILGIISYCTHINLLFNHKISQKKQIKIKTTHSRQTFYYIFDQSNVLFLCIILKIDSPIYFVCFYFFFHFEILVLSDNNNNFCFVFIFFFNKLIPWWKQIRIHSNYLLLFNFSEFSFKSDINCFCCVFCVCGY